MSLSYNGTELQSITWNGADLQTVTMDGVEVWSAHPPFLVRMRYDANEATHVKDLVGGYTITTNTGGAVPAAADPFGGNNAFNLNDIYIRYGGAKVIPGGKTTVCFWFKPSTTDGLVLSNDKGRDNYVTRAITYIDRKIRFTGNASRSTTINPANINLTQRWYFVEVSTDGNVIRIFIDGVLGYQGTDSLNEVTPNWKDSGGGMFIGTAFSSTSTYKCKCYIYDFCILDGIWHTENYNVPTAYI